MGDGPKQQNRRRRERRRRQKHWKDLTHSKNDESPVHVGDFRDDSHH